MKPIPFDDDLQALARGDTAAISHFEDRFRPLVRLMLTRHRVGSLDSVIWDEVLAAVRAAILAGEVTEERALGRCVHSTCSRVLLEKVRPVKNTQGSHAVRILRILSTLPERDAAILRAHFAKSPKGAGLTRRYWRV